MKDLGREELYKLIKQLFWLIYLEKIDIGECDSIHMHRNGNRKFKVTINHINIGDFNL